MSLLIELDYKDIEDLKEAIEGSSDTDMLELVSGEETYIQSLIEDLEDYLNDISDLKDEIEGRLQTVFCNDVQNALKDAGYNIPWDSNGNLTITLGCSVITITPMRENISVSFTSENRQLSYRKLMSKLLLDYKQDRNFFSFTCPEKELIGKLIDTINALINAKELFKEINSNK